MNGKECLETALKCVNGDRDIQYGRAENNFQKIADFWNTYLGIADIKISASDVAAMMALMKIARISTGLAKEDSWVDCAGYCACGCEIQTSGNGGE